MTENPVIIGDCTLYRGDCLEIMPSLRKVGAVVMDPPYNFSTASAGAKHALWADAVNSAYWFTAVLSACRDTIAGNSGFIWQFLNWKTFIPAQKACWDAGMKFESLLVWDKEWIGPGGPLGLRPSYELVALMSVGGAAIPNRGLPDIWRHKWSSQRETGHPAEKPISLLNALIQETPAQSVLDPFMGSGTTGVAAARYGRAFVGIEMEKKYFDIACKRIEQAYDQPDMFIEPPKPAAEQADLMLVNSEKETGE